MILINLLLTLVLLLVAISGLNYVLRLLDHRAGFYWPNVREMLETNPLPASIYFGARVLAVAIIFNAVVGRYIV